jgi:hypothetical protein
MLLLCRYCLDVLKGLSAYVIRIRQSKEERMAIFVDRTEFYLSLSEFSYLL